MPAHLELTPAWQEITRRLRQAVGDSAYEIWLAPLQPRAWDGSVLVLEGKPGTDGWVSDRYGPALERCARAVLGQSAHVVFAGDAASAAHSALGDRHRVATAAGAGRADSVASAEHINPRHTFDQFVIGDGNRLAHAAALAVAENPGQAYNPLFLHAPPGLGKTHLLGAIANYVTAFQPGTTVRYTTVEAFTNGFIAALNAKVLERFKQLYRNVDVLLIDDIQFLASKAKTEEEFFHTFNALYDTGRQLVLTCDRLPGQLTGIEQRLRERFESGLVAHLTAPDWRTRMTILQKRAALDRIQIDDDQVLPTIAERVTDNVRQLEGALIRVVAHHSLTGQPLDCKLAATVLDAIHPRALRPGSSANHPLTPNRILKTVAEHFELASTDITGQSRQARVAWARQLGMYLSRELTDTPLNGIGQAYGGRNHATVLHACRRVSDRITINTDDAADLQDLTEILRHPQS